MSRFATRCPNCGAPIVFAWSQSVQTVCPHCRSLVVRHDVDLRALGLVAAAPPDISPIQLGTHGRFEGRAFEVVGRIAYEYEDGGWNEWHIVFDDGESGWLSDAQAEYAISRAAQPPKALPSRSELEVGRRFRFEGREYVTTTVTWANYAAVEGELPFITWDRTRTAFADLKTTSGHFATIDYSEDPPLLFLGRFAEVEELALTNLREFPGGLAESAVRGFNCSACGAAIALRAAQLTANVACPACGTIVSPHDPDLRVLQEAAARQAHAPKIPLGTRGTLDGQPWEVIGFQYRTITVEDEVYGWDEYLLLNPYHGFRYLSEYQGHWNVIRSLKQLPVGDLTTTALYDGRRFRRFQAATATTRVVYGEFPWQVRAGDTVKTTDFISPPLMLSREGEGTDQTWSLGAYTPGRTIWTGFSLPGTPPRAIGVFANQPSPYAGRPRVFWTIFALLAFVWLALVGGRFLLAGRRIVFEGRYAFTPAATTVAPPAEDAAAFVTPEFEVPGDLANLEVRAEAPGLDNDWLSLAIALVNVETGSALDSGLELSYYAGVEDGERWTEGSRTASLMLPEVPRGKYLLRIDPAGGVAGRRIDYSVRVRRDVPRLFYPLLALGLLAIPPLLASRHALGFESRRWEESSDEDDE